MRFVECEVPKSKRAGYGVIQNFVADFSRSGIACAKVVDIGDRGARCVPAQINVAAKRIGMPHIVAFMCNKEIYIKNKILLKGDSDEITENQ